MKSNHIFISSAVRVQTLKVILRKKNTKAGKHILSLHLEEVVCILYHLTN